jgi:hypothetical protein
MAVEHHNFLVSCMIYPSCAPEWLVSLISFFLSELFFYRPSLTSQSRNEYHHQLEAINVVVSFFCADSAKVSTEGFERTEGPDPKRALEYFRSEALCPFQSHFIE